MTALLVLAGVAVVGVVWGIGWGLWLLGYWMGGRK